MEGHRLILANGTMIEDGRAALSGGMLCLWMPGLTMQEVCEFVFTDAMDKIIYQYGDESETYNGYTKCQSLVLDGDEMNVFMVKG